MKYWRARATGGRVIHLVDAKTGVCACGFQVNPNRRGYGCSGIWHGEQTWMNLPDCEKCKQAAGRVVNDEPRRAGGEERKT